MNSPANQVSVRVLILFIIIVLLVTASPAGAVGTHQIVIPGTGKYPVPVLQVNDSMEPVILNQEISTEKGTGIYTIPAGSIILLSDDGINRIFDADGTQFLAMYDTGKHRIHTVPNGAFVDSGGNITYILSGSQLVMTVIDATDRGIAQPTPNPVIASFSPMPPTQGDAPLKVTFSDYSQGSVSDWNWSFGDGSVSNERNPVHTYQANGTYNVTLIVTGPSGTDMFTYRECVTVGPLPPLARIGADPQRADYAPLMVTFTDTSMGDITGWSWDFGDGTTSTEQNPVHTYRQQGNYSVLLTVSGPAGKSTMEDPVFILVGPFPPFAYFEAIYTSKPAPCSVEFMQYSEGTITEWLWDFGDGTTSREKKPAHLYKQNGNFTVNLSVSGPEGSSTKSRPFFIHVGEPFFIRADPIDVHPVGDRFTITGETNLPADAEMAYAVMTSSFNPGGPRFGNPSNASGQTRVVPGMNGNNSWSFELDTTGFRPDEYYVALDSTTFTDVYGTSLFTLIKGKYPPLGQQAPYQQTSPGYTPVNVTVSLLPSETHPAPLFPPLALLAPGFAGMVYAAVRSRRRPEHG